MSRRRSSDPNGNLSTFVDPNGKTTTYAYDALNRLTTITPDASLTSQTPIGFTYYPTGQRKTMTDASGTTTYAYTARNQLLSKATPQGTLSYTYNLAGGVQTLRSSNTNGITVTYGYDELNRLSTVIDNRLTVGANTTTYGYDPDSDLQTTTLPNGVLTSATFNTLDRLTRLTTQNTSTLADYNYTILGAAGERQRVVELSGRQVDYGYDNAYRLTSETISVATPSGAIGATYDHTGDRLTRTSTVTGIAAASATYDANDRQTGITYDNNGNTTLASGVTYGYDFLNHLTSATGSITLKYDGDGNRVQETAGGVTTNFLVDDNNPSGVPQVVEELVGGVVQRQYTYGHTLISQNQTSGVSFYGMDASHNVRFLTNTAGAITDQYTYDAFGNAIVTTGTTPNSYRFAGEYLDANLGLYYLRARYYNASVGRFWSRDPAELNPDDPRELNRYVYTADNPVNATDPSGLLAIENEGLNQNSGEESEGAAGGGNAAADAEARTAAQLNRTYAQKDFDAFFGTNPATGTNYPVTVGRSEYLDINGVAHEFGG